MDLSPKDRTLENNKKKRKKTAVSGACVLGLREAGELCIV